MESRDGGGGSFGPCANEKRACFLVDLFAVPNTEIMLSHVLTPALCDMQLDFLSEAEMMKRFDHENIVKLLGVCTRGEPAYTIMEFMLHGNV